MWIYIALQGVAFFKCITVKWINVKVGALMLFIGQKENPVQEFPQVGRSLPASRPASPGLTVEKLTSNCSIEN